MEGDNNDWDKITVEDINNLIQKTVDFYQERNWPNVNAFWLADLFLKRLKNDLDYYVNCEGQKGYGKSNLMLLLALLQSRYSGLWKNKLTNKIVRVLPRMKPLPSEWEHIEPGFSFKNNMSFLDESQDIKKKYNELDRYHPFVIDEGSKNLHKHNWQNKLQFMLVKLSDVARYQNKTFFVCFPHFSELNSVFRNDRVMMRLYVYNRNVNKHYASAIISLKDVNRYVMDPWHTEDNAKEFERLLYRIPASLRNADHILRTEKKLKGYAGNFDFPELKIIAPKIWEIYLRYKIENAKKDSKSDNEDQQVESVNIKRWKLSISKAAFWIKERYPDMKWNEIAPIFGITGNTLSQIRALQLPDKKDYKEIEHIISTD